jgi:hypothetical protein
MNIFGFSSESPHWWWPIGAATAAATTMTGVIFSVSVPGSAYGISTHDPDAVGTGHGYSHVVPGPCFIHPVRWDEVFGGPFPVCYHRVPGK